MVQYFHTMPCFLPFEIVMVMHVPDTLCWKFVICFFGFTGNYRREFGLLSNVEIEGLWKTCEVGINAFLCYCNYMPMVEYNGLHVK